MPSGNNTTQYVAQNPATGTSADILNRLKAVIPNRWFAYVAPLRDAVLGGLSDLAAWCYSWIVFAVQQSRIATSTGPFLDIIAYDFFGRTVQRNGSNDNAFRTRILALLFQERVTRAGMIGVITRLTGTAPIIIEPWNPGDCGGWDTGTFAFAGESPASGGGGGWDIAGGWDAGEEYDTPPTVAEVVGVGAGCWGDTNLPAQVFLTVTRPGVQGIPNVAGFDSAIGGFDIGAIELTDPSQITGAVTDSDIYAAINATRPTGVIAWTALQG